MLRKTAENGSEKWGCWITMGAKSWAISWWLLLFIIPKPTINAGLSSNTLSRGSVFKNSFLLISLAKREVVFTKRKKWPQRYWLPLRIPEYHLLAQSLLMLLTLCFKAMRFLLIGQWMESILPPSIVDSTGKVVEWIELYRPLSTVFYWFYYV